MVTFCNYGGNRSDDGHYAKRSGGIPMDRPCDSRCMACCHRACCFSAVKRTAKEHALALLYFLFSKWGKDARLVLAAAAFGIWNPLAVKTLYVMGNPGKFVVCVLGYAVLGSVVWILLQKRKSQNKISPWIVFAVLLILVLQVVYYENTIILQSDVQYWYNEEPFMTGE